MKRFDLFDAVRVVSLPEGKPEIRAYYSSRRGARIRVGDVGVVIGPWPKGRYRVEAVDSRGAILWQDHFEPDQLELVRVTEAEYSRRRIHEHWATQLLFRRELLDPARRTESLGIARKVMAFARRNVEWLVRRLESSGYRFANPHGPWQTPEEGLSESVEELARQGFFVPVALQAWLMEVGCVDLCGTHPEWKRSACVGLSDEDSDKEPWFSDPLVLDARLGPVASRPDRARCEDGRFALSLAPDSVTKANVSGGGPVTVFCDVPAFDVCLAGQHGSLTLLSYLRWAFEWSGFPGFDYIPDAPREMLKEWGRGLTRL